MGVAALEALFGKPGDASLIKVTDCLTPDYRCWIIASRFCVLSTIGPEGTDGSPRGRCGPTTALLRLARRRTDYGHRAAFSCDRFGHAGQGGVSGRAQPFDPDDIRAGWIN